MQNYWNVYHWMYKQQQLSRPVSYQDFRETGPRVSMTTKATKETMHPWEWGCHWSTRMRFTWIKLPDSATSHNSFALKARACYRQSQTSHARRLNLSNMKCCYYSGKNLRRTTISLLYTPAHYIGIQRQDHLICKVIVCIKPPGAYLFQTHLGGGGGGLLNKEEGLIWEGEVYSI